MDYLLKGEFVECCDCFTVCPCWVSDVPDEDHCSGLYVWSFDKGSAIGGTSVAGMQVAAATYHAVRGGGQVMFFIDAGPAPQAGTVKLLLDAFCGRLGGADLEALARLLGDCLGHQQADITAKFKGNDFDVSVMVQSIPIARAAGRHKIFPEQAAPMTLKDTALSKRLGVGVKDVTVQDMRHLMVDVAALPGGPLNFRGRSGMRSEFSYMHRAKPTSRPRNDAQDSLTEEA